MTKETKFWQEMAMHHRWRLRKLQKGTTPKGLKIKVMPKVALPKQLQNKWQDAIIICEKQLINILEEFYEDQLFGLKISGGYKINYLHYVPCNTFAYITLLEDT